MIPREALDNHAGLSPEARQLLELAASNPAGRAPVRVEEAGAPDWVTEYYATYGCEVQSWPTYVGGAALEEMRSAVSSVSALVGEIPARIFDNKPKRLAQVYGLADEYLALAILKPPSGLDAVIGRGDFLHTAEGFRCMELNMSASIGGWELSFLTEYLTGRPWLADLRSRPARYRDPLRHLFEHLVGRAEARLSGPIEELNLAFMIDDSDAAMLSTSRAADIDRWYRAFLEQRGSSYRGHVLLATYDALRADRSGVKVRGSAVEAVVEMHQPFTAPEVFRAFKAGKVDLYNGYAKTLLDDKRNLAFLSECQEDPRFFEPHQRQQIRAFIPWTRIVREGSVEYQGEREDLPALLRRRQQDFVIKHGRGREGTEVFIGGSLAPEEWEAVVQGALQSEMWVVQERLTSLPYWFQTVEGGIEPHDVVWGLFTFGHRYGGGYLRGERLGGSGIINTARGAFQGLILEVGEASEEAANASSPPFRIEPQTGHATRRNP